MATTTESKSQLKRFVQAAREHGTDDSEEAFDRALKKVAKAPPAPMHKVGSTANGTDDAGKTRSAGNADPRKRAAKKPRKERG